jgi:hypothetical protein
MGQDLSGLVPGDLSGPLVFLAWSNPGLIVIAAMGGAPLLRPGRSDTRGRTPPSGIGLGPFLRSGTNIDACVLQ